MSARRSIAVASAATAAFVAATASAQVYRCSSGGSTWISDRPCAGSVARTPPPSSGRTTLGAAGPVPQRPAVYMPDYRPAMPKAPEHVRYLSPGCASLNEAIRTGPARGLRSAAMADLHTEYRSKCAEDESEALQRLSRERQDERVARREARAVEQAEQQRSQREREQCGELLRILHGKRQRLATMTAGERADLERSEGAYHARCGTR